MSDALPLPPRPDLSQYRKLAKDLQRACASQDPNAIHEWATRWTENIRRLHGPAITPVLTQQIASEVRNIERRWKAFRESGPHAAACTLADAQHHVARGHGFASWARFAKYLQALDIAHSPVSRFEAAVDAIVSGDASKLAALLQADPQLAHARSLREHHSTLLHYVSANGVEDFRQITPPNIVTIAMLLLDAGSDINAASLAYGGGSTALSLTATSGHPEHAGVQLPLLQLLIDRGATIDPPGSISTVNSCLRNGRGIAARFLADRGARLDFEDAAGVGRLDLVRQLLPSASVEHIRNAFAWACQFGQIPIIELLLDQGFDIATATLPHHRQTGLHWAAFSGEVETVRYLLQRHAPLEIKDETFHGTPLGWALYAWTNLPGHPAAAHRSTRYCEIAALLVHAGAIVDADLLSDPKITADSRMSAALQPIRSTI